VRPDGSVVWGGLHVESSAGDAVIRQVGAHVSAALRPGDTIARLTCSAETASAAP
jgi:hypothetical protein